MKYIKRHKLVVEGNDDKIEIGGRDTTSIAELKERFNELKDEIKDFDVRKSKLEKVIIDNTDNKDISKVIDDIVDKNRFLTMYLPIVKKMAELKSTEGRIEYYKQLLKERDTDLKLSAKLSDLEERQEQNTKLSKQIEDIKEKGKAMQDRLKELLKQVDEEKKDLKKYIDNMRKQFEEDIRNLNIDVRTV